MTATSSRINRIDRAWAGHWEVMCASPVDPPDVAKLRAAYVAFLAGHPSHPLATRLSEDGRSWLQIAPADRAAYAERVIRSVDQQLPANPQEALVDFVSGLDPFDAVNIAVGPGWVALQTSHMALDGFGLDLALSAATTCDFSRVLTLSRRASVPLLLGAIARGLPAFGRQWLAIAAHRDERLAGSADEPVVPASSWAGRPPQLRADTYGVSSEEFTRVNEWRKKAVPGATLNSVVTAGVWRALRAEGIPLTSAGFNGLFDMRRFLPKEQQLIGGNLAKSLFVPADMTDPMAIQERVSRTVSSGRALPATLLGAFSRHAGPGVPVDGPMVLTFSAVPYLPRDDTHPYRDGTQHRIFGFGYPVSPTGISVFTVRLRDSTEIQASFDARTIDPAAVRRALERMGDIPALLES